MSRQRDPLHRFALIPLLAVLAMPACDKGGEEAKDEKKAEEDAGPAVKVQLPPSPDFDEGKAPVTHEDSSFSVYGLRKDIGYNTRAGAEILERYWIDYAVKKKEHTQQGGNENLARATYAQRAAPLPAAAALPQLGTPTFLTANSDFYRNHTALRIPTLAAAT